MRPRSMFVVAVLLLALSMMGFASLASAMPTVEGIVDFYSDDTYSTWVGYIWWTCNGRSQGGTITSYSIPENPFDSCGTHQPTFCYYDVVLYCSS